jgi:hypothetical protein
MAIKQNNANVVTTCEQRLAALGKYVRTKTTMTVSGEQMKLSDLTAIYQTALDTRAALIPQRAAFKKALSAKNGAEVARRSTDRKLKAWVVNTFGAGSQEAEEFGFLPPKVPEKSAAVKAAAAEKSKATREAKEGTTATQVTAAPTTPAAAAVTTTPAKQ